MSLQSIDKEALACAIGGRGLNEIVQDANLCYATAEALRSIEQRYSSEDAKNNFVLRMKACGDAAVQEALPRTPGVSG